VDAATANDSRPECHSVNFAARMEENDRAGYGAAASTALALGEGLANAAGAFTGVNGIIEGVSGQELWTGNQLSTMDRWTRGLGGVGTLLTAGVGVGELADVAQEGLRVFSCGVPEAFADDGLAGAADRMLENAGDFVSGSGVNCFTAGTQVVVGLVVVGNDGAQQEIRSQLELDLATSPAGGVATAVKVCGYLTKAIETIESGQCLVSRDEDDASAPLVFRRIEDRFGNTAYGLIHVTLLSSGGIQHTISTTVEHPIFVPGRGWIRVSELSAGDALEDICGLSTVLACQTATQLSGVGVFNLRVNRSRTYFVREPHCNAEPLWVHNTCGGSVPPTAVDGEGAGIAAEGIPGATRLSEVEQATAQRLLNAQPELKLTESAHEGAEYVDQFGRTYDALGNPKASQFWNEQQFLNQIDKHLLKSNDFTVVDLTGFTDAQITTVKSYINSLPAASQAKIIRIGF
jgi:hypothetical protein